MGIWRLNLEELNVADVETFPTPPMSVSRQQRLDRQREQTNNPREGGQDITSKGWDLPRHTIVFKLVGEDGQALADELEFIVNELEQNKVVTLEAPSNEDAWPYLNKKRVPLTVENWDNDPSDSHAKQRIQLQSLVLGEWTQDGGDYYETLDIRFHQTNSDPTYEREDGTTQSNFEITLDAQDTGYPKAKNPSTLAYDQLSPVSTGTRTLRNGDEVVTETYDLSGYLFPSDPSATGDTGLATVRQSPALGIVQALAATLESASSVTATLEKIGESTATITSDSAVAAALLQIHESTATLTSDSAVSAALQKLGEVSATVSSDSSVQASLIRQQDRVTPDGTVRETPDGTTRITASS